MKEYNKLQKDEKASLPANAINWRSEQLVKNKVLYNFVEVKLFKSKSVHRSEMHKPMIKDV